jgi:MFS family permease
LLSLAAVCPFVGSISDLIGRRYVAIAGAAFVCLGMIICSTAKEMNTFIGGMVFAGIGAGINELTALAVTSELAPTAKRGKYVAILIFTIIPFCPSVLWGQLIAYYSNWRYIGLICGIWNFIGLVMTAVFYFPPPRVNSSGMSRNEILAQIDYVGGFLSVVGMILFMAVSRSWPMLRFSRLTFNRACNGAATNTHGAAHTFSHLLSSAQSSSSLSSSGKATSQSTQCSQSVSSKILASSA